MSRLKKAGAMGAGLSALAALAITTVGGFEGLRLKTYRDIVGIPTICYGETRGVRMGQVLTKPECDAMLLKGLDQFGDQIEACLPQLRMAPESVYAAHLSLAYNIGAGAYCRSTAAQLLRTGAHARSCEALTRFNKAGGRVVAGLVRRREEERRLCLRDIR